MGYKIKALDITELECDVIINSLGSGDFITSYGRLCRSIVEKNNSYNFEAEIASHKKEAKPGFSFVTKGYNIKAKHIIHICTPYFIYDKQMYGLELVYIKALLYAYDKKWYKVGLPIIGTGANGYSSYCVYKMVNELVKSFVKVYKEMKITVCQPIPKEQKLDSKFDPEIIKKKIEDFYKDNSSIVKREFIYNKKYFERCRSIVLEDELNFCTDKMSEEEYIKKYMPNPKEYVKREDLQKEMDAILESGKRPVKVNINELEQFSITHYIDAYIDNRFLDDVKKEVKNQVNLFLEGSKSSTSLRTKHKDPDRRANVAVATLMRYILALHMNREEADDFLKFCGRAFSDVGDEDVMYVELIERRIYDKDMLTKEYSKYFKNLIFAYEKND